MDGWKTNSFPFGDLAYFQVLLLLFSFEGGGSLFIPSVTPPQVLCFHTHFPCSHHVGCAHWAAGRSRRSTGARGTGAGGRQTAGRRVRATGAKAGLDFSHSQGKLAVFQAIFKLALYIIPIYLGSGWRNWSNTYYMFVQKYQFHGWLNLPLFF